MSDLDGVTIAFDLDNTLLDPTGDRYGAVTSEFLGKCDLGLDADSLRDTFERVRRWGPVLARLGLANPLHDRGHVDGLAALALLFGAKSDSLSKLGDVVARRDAFVATLDKLDELARATRRGTPQERLAAERVLRSALSSAKASELRVAVGTVSESHALREWSANYNAIEDAHAVEDVHCMLQSLIERGAKCVVITQGQSKFQREKIERLGIAKLLSGCVLITQDARWVAGYELLDARIDELLADENTNDELRKLWVYRCLLDMWGSKSPSFYGRCVHAIHGWGYGAQERLTGLTTVSLEDWATDPPRLVMIGDRYEKDIRPLIELLGSGAVMTLHLTAGKYNEDFSASDLPVSVRPTRSFGSMSAVWNFLEQELSVASVPLIIEPPPIAPAGWFDKDVLDFGENCDLECVRNVAGAIVATQR